MSIKVSIAGREQMMKLLRELPSAVSRKVILSAQRKVLKQTADATRANLASSAQQKTGNLTRAIGVKALRGKDSSPTSLAGVITSKGGWHAHLLEAGTRERYHRKRKVIRFINKAGQTIVAYGQRTGKMTPIRFVQKAKDITSSKVLQEFEQELAKSLVRRMKDTIKKSGGSFKQ